MFTGIVEEIGTVRAAQAHGDVFAVQIQAIAVLGTLAPGASIALSGCCLTVTGVERGAFRCDLAPETLRRTAFGERLRPGALVNLERPLRADGRFDGHFVQGHVDGVARLLERRDLGGSAELVLDVPAELDRYVAVKGSVALDGVSLTVAGREAGRFTAALIPYTLQHTNLGSVRPGERLNLEVDVIAKYVERLLAPRS
jgi:riboflavin synthase